MSSSSISKLHPQSNNVWMFITFLIALAIRIYHLGTISLEGSCDQIFALGLEHKLPWQWLVGINMILGSLTASIIYLIAFTIYSRKWDGIVAALIIAFQPWHIYYSLNMKIEIILGFLITITTYFLLKRRTNFFSLISGLTALTSSMSWIILLLESAVLYREHRSKKISLIISPFGIIGLLLIYLYLNKKYLMAVFPHISNTFSSYDLLFYFNSLFLMTFSLFYLGFIFALLKNRSSRLISIIVFVYVLIISILYSPLGWQDISQLIIILPLISLMIVTIMPRFNGKNIRKVLVSIALFFIIVIPYLSQIAFIK